MVGKKKKQGSANHARDESLGSSRQVPRWVAVRPLSSGPTNRAGWDAPSYRCHIPSLGLRSPRELNRLVLSVAAQRKSGRWWSFRSTDVPRYLCYYFNFTHNWLGKAQRSIYIYFYSSVQPDQFANRVHGHMQYIQETSYRAVVLQGWVTTQAGSLRDKCPSYFSGFTTFLPRYFQISGFYTLWSMITGQVCLQPTFLH